MITAKVGRRGQITIPKEIRERLAVEEGQRVAFVVEGDRVALEPLTTTLRDHRGIVRVRAPQDFGTIRRSVRRRRSEEPGDRGKR
ncbi:MAG: AbrB/MazE/SpoVT family DNA-binding domain-containing protein [Gemmatimonadetes bacterium]|nr:AbrB/MazE/SpoVT family DNA-binding domain-containing protein [Gemmatimonadota bacterium]